MAIAYVKDTGKIRDNTAGASADFSFGSLPSAGNLVLLYVWGWDTSSVWNFTTATDNQGNTYAKAVESTENDNLRAAIFYAYNIGSPAGTFTITANASETIAIFVGAAVEYSGFAATDPLDVTRGLNTANSVNPATGTTGATAQNDELVAIIQANTAAGTVTTTTPAGYTSRVKETDNTNWQAGDAADKIVGATGTQAGTWTISPGGPWTAAIATFKAIPNTPLGVTPAETAAVTESVGITKFADVSPLLPSVFETVTVAENQTSTPTLDRVSTGSATGSTLTIPHITGTLADGLMVVSISSQESNEANLPITSVKYNGVSLSRADYALGTNLQAELWYLLNPDAGSHDVVISGSIFPWKGAVVSTWSGIRPSGQPDATSTATGFSQPSLSITPTAANALVIDALSSERVRIALGAGQSNVGTSQGQSFENVSASYRVAATPAAYSMSETISQPVSWASVAASFAPSIALVAIADGATKYPSASEDAAVTESVTVGIVAGATKTPSVSDAAAVSESVSASVAVATSALRIGVAGALAGLPERSIDIMQDQKDYVRNQFSDTWIERKVAFLAQNFNLTHAVTAVPLNTNADFTAAGVSLPSPRTIEAYQQKWVDEIHNNGLGVIFRGADCGMEGLYDFLKLDGADRIPTGTVASAPTDGTATWLGRVYKYIVDHPTLFRAGDIWAPYPERTEGIFSDSTAFLDNSGSGTAANYANFFVNVNTVSKAAFTAISKQNLFPNPSFETGTGGWSMDSHFTRGTDPSTGSWAIHQVSPSGFLNFTTQNDSANGRPVIPNKTYTVSYQAKGTVVGNPPQIQVNSGSAYGTPLNSFTTVAGSASYTRRSFTFNSGNNTKVWLRITNNNGNVDMYYDAFQLELGTLTSYFETAVPHGITTGYTANNWSEINSGWLGQSILTDAGVTAFDHYGTDGAAHSVAEMQSNYDSTYANRGLPMFHQEWGDYWNGSMSQAARTAYLQQMYAMMGTYSNSGKLKGFNYWGGWTSGSGEQLLTLTGTTSNPTFGLRFNGVILQTAFGTGIAEATTVSESVTVALGAQAALQISVNNCTGVSDSATVRNHLRQTVIEATTVTDVPNVVKHNASDISFARIDNVTVSESVTSGITAKPTVTDDAAVTEAVSVSRQAASLIQAFVLEDITTADEPFVSEPPGDIWVYDEQLLEDSATVHGTDAVVITTGESSNSQALGAHSLTWPHTVVGSNRILVVAAAAENNGTNGEADMAVSSVTYNGRTLERITDETITVSSKDRVELWYLLGPDLGTHDITIEWAGVNPAVIGMALSLEGIDQQGAVQTWAEAVDETSSPTVTLTTHRNNSYVINAIVSSNDSDIISVANGQELQNVTALGYMRAGLSISGPYPDSEEVTMSWSKPGTDAWASVAAVLKPPIIWNNDVQDATSWANESPNPTTWTNELQS